MKKACLIVLCVLLIGGVACRRGTAVDAGNKITKAADLNTQTKKASYAIGLDIGQNFQARSMDIDLESLIQGLRDAQPNRQPLLGKEEIEKVMNQFREELMKNAQQKRLAQAQTNAAQADAFLKQNAAQTGVKTTASGLQYKVLKEGAGPMPKASDTVKVHYRGTLVDGTEFDSSFKRNEPAVFPLNGVIKGWTEALQLMKVGSKWQIVLPSSLAYGEQGAGQLIGPNATLIFEVELLGIEKSAAPGKE